MGTTLELWSEECLDDLIDTKTIGLVKNSKEQGDNFDYDYVKMHNISNDNTWNPVKVARVNATEAELEKFSLKEGDLLFNTRNSFELVGKSCLYESLSDNSTVFNNNIMRIRFQPKVDQRFAAYAFCSSQVVEQLEGMKQGTTNVSAIYYKTLKDLRIRFPPIPEQKRIVALLDTVFADLEQTRAKTEQNLKNARELFDSYLQQVFSQKGEGWVDLPLGDICNFKHGFAFKSEFFVDKSKLILLTPGSFYEDGGYRDRGEKTKYYEGDFPAEYLVKKGDLLVAMTEQAVGLLGSSALVPENNTFLHNQRLGLVELTPEFKNKVSLKFLFHLFNTKNFRAKVQETATGLKVRHTSPKKMQVISVPILNDVIEQELIAQKLFEAKERVIELEAIYQQKLDSIDELKKSILQKAFSGELTHD